MGLQWFTGSMVYCGIKRNSSQKVYIFLHLFKTYILQVYIELHVCVGIYFNINSVSLWVIENDLMMIMYNYMYPGTVKRIFSEMVIVP